MRPRVPPLNFKIPSLKVSAALVLAMLGFGVLIGEAARNSVQDTLVASSRPHVELFLPRRAAPSSSASTAGSQGTGEAANEGAAAPESEPAPTPAATPHHKSTSRATNGKKGEGEGTGKASPKPPQPTPDTKLPAIKHVFVIMLSDQPYAAAFGPESPARYVTGKLEPKGALLAHYDAIAHEGLADEIGLLSGQGPTAETAADCATYTAIPAAPLGADGQVLGNGCVYPASTPTLPGQLSAAHVSWRAYIGGIDEPGAVSGACAHPTLGGADPSAGASAGTGPYSTYINPFVYFASITGSPSCQSEDVGLLALRHDLASAASTPGLSYIAPSRCEDGNPVPCAPGAPAGVAPADAFLKRVVPEILASKAYRQSGLLVITVDDAPSSGAFEDSSSCCGQPPYPNLPTSLSESPSGRPKGGGAVGALLLSPFIRGPESSQEPYNHFSLLATIEELFGVKRLGYAALTGVKALEPSLFSEAG